jgi:hypothetical protein
LDNAIALQKSTDRLRPHADEFIEMMYSGVKELGQKDLEKLHAWLAS